MTAIPYPGREPSALGSRARVVARGGTRTAPAWWETTFLCGMLFALTYGTPNEWFRQFHGVEGTLSAIVFFTPMLTAGVVLGLTRFPQFAQAIRTEPLLIALVVWSFASTLWSETPNDTFRQATAWVLATGFTCWIPTRFSLKQVLEQFANALLFGTVLNLVWVHMLTKWGHISVWWNPIESGWKGITANKNTLGQVTATSVLVMVMAWRGLDRHKNWYLLGAIANLYMLIRTDSKTSLVACVGTLALMGCFQVLRAQKQLFAAAVLFLLSAATVSVFLIMANFSSLAAGLGRNGDLTGRTQLWADIWPEVMERPVLGYGMGGFWNGFFSAAHDVWVKNSWQPPDAHNILLNIALELGFVGVFLFSVAFIRVYKRAIIFLRDSNDPAALLPLTWLTYLFLASITEKGFLGRTSGWTIFLVCAIAVGQHHKASRRRPTA